MKSPWNFSKFELLMYFQLYKAANFYKYHKKSGWHCRGSQEGKKKEDALALAKNNNLDFWTKLLEKMVNFL